MLEIWFPEHTVTEILNSVQLRPTELLKWRSQSIRILAHKRMMSEADLIFHLILLYIYNLD
jgi:hypothetical protein